MGRICVRCDGLVGPCMVGFGAAWMLLHGCMYKCKTFSTFPSNFTALKQPFKKYIYFLKFTLQICC